MFRGKISKPHSAFIAGNQTKGRESVWYDPVPSVAKKIQPYFHRGGSFCSPHCSYEWGLLCYLEPFNASWLTSDKD